MYNFGDNRENYMKVVGREPPLEGEDFRCLSGVGHYVAEDVGSKSGWNRLKEAYAAANPTKEQRENMEWFETQCSNNDPKGLREDRINFVDIDAINKALAGEL